MAGFSNPKDYSRAYPYIMEYIKNEYTVINDYWYVMGMASFAEEVGAITREQYENIKEIAIARKIEIEEAERKAAEEKANKRRNKK